MVSSAHLHPCALLVIAPLSYTISSRWWVWDISCLPIGKVSLSNSAFGPQVYPCTLGNLVPQNAEKDTMEVGAEGQGWQWHTALGQKLGRGTSVDEATGRGDWQCQRYPIVTHTLTHLGLARWVPGNIRTPVPCWHKCRRLDGKGILWFCSGRALILMPWGSNLTDHVSLTWSSLEINTDGSFILDVQKCREIYFCYLSDTIYDILLWIH